MSDKLPCNKFCFSIENLSDIILSHLEAKYITAAAMKIFTE